jgi:hypothetical protein
MDRQTSLTRRWFLRGTGMTLALPWLESLAAGQAATAAGSPGQPAAMPLRMAFLYVPNGIHMPDWTPKNEGALGDLPPILKPLEAVKAELLLLSGLALDGGRPYADGPGDHSRALASFLTTAHPVKTHGKDIRAGISVDQAAAAAVGHKTRFPSLELGHEPSALAGNCDSGYSCAYSSNISWRTPTSPLGKETSPQAVFDRLFGKPPGREGDKEGSRQHQRRKSILDFVAEDAQDLQRRLSGSDRVKLDEYLYAVREVERRVIEAEQSAGKSAKAPDYPRPAGSPKDFAGHVRLMFDLMALAFQTDSTRIITFVYANEGSNRSYPEIGVTSGHHELSHHGGDPKKHAGISAINRYHVTLLSHFLGKLRALQEGDTTLLDRSMVVYGSGLSDGNRHNHDDLPVLLAGRAGGTLRPGRHLRFAPDTPLANLYLGMLWRMGVKAEKFGDSREELAGLR